MNAQQKGSCAEHLAIAALTYNGYTVYQNTALSGITDLIAEKDGTTYRVQAKSFQSKRSYGGYHKSHHVYQVIDLRSSFSEGGGYHLPYAGRVDLMAAVDLDTAEVYLFPPEVEGRKTQASKNQLGQYKIYPA